MTNFLRGKQIVAYPRKTGAMSLTWKWLELSLHTSITQGGPGFPYLCPAIVSFMFTLSSEDAINAIPTTKLDIPLNLSTTDLIDLIFEVTDTRGMIAKKFKNQG